MVRTITVQPNFPLKKGDFILVREPLVYGPHKNGLRLRYDVAVEVPKDRKRSQAFNAKVSVFGGRA